MQQLISKQYLFIPYWNDAGGSPPSEWHVIVTSSPTYAGCGLISKVRLVGATAKNKNLDILLIIGDYVV